MKRGFYFFINSIVLISFILLGIGPASPFLPSLLAENSVADSTLPMPRTESSKRFLDVPQIKPEKLKKLIDEKADIVLVDTQDERMYQIAHIKRAINFPWATTIKNPINLPRNKTLIIYCGCVDQEASFDVATQLIRDYGYKDIQVLEGGFQQWIKLGYPVEKNKRK